MDAEELKRIIREEVERVKKSKKARTGEKADKVSEEKNEIKKEFSIIKPEIEEKKEHTSVIRDKTEEDKGSDYKWADFDLDEMELLDLKQVQSETVLKFLEVLFEKWHLENSNTSDAVMKKIHRESRQDVEPLFSNLRASTLSPNILQLIAEMASCMQHRDYVKANDAYLRLAIGNSPWPIGVNSVLIHERTSQARISSNQVAHVLNDEVSRKWIQMLKRLITFCQKIRPPSDRSKLMP